MVKIMTRFGAYIWKLESTCDVCGFNRNCLGFDSGLKTPTRVNICEKCAGRLFAAINAKEMKAVGK